MSIFSSLVAAPPDIILHTATLFKKDTFEKKVNLGVGAYRDNDDKPVVFQCVRKAIEAVSTLNLEYLPIEGCNDLLKPAAKLIFGADDAAYQNGSIATVQALSGTGSLRVIGEFLHEVIPGAQCLVTEPTWGNHIQIFERSGFKVVKAQYWDAAARTFAFDAYLGALNAAPEGSLIVLHGCAHNPTGIDPTQAQWETLLDAIIAKRHVPLFDTAYQGFASGSLEKDAYAIRRFRAKAPDATVLVAQSFAKNMGLYGERVGCVHVVTASPEQREIVMSRLKVVTRASISSPPLSGRIAAHILNNEELYNQWISELKAVAERIHKVRVGLKEKLEERLGVAKDTWGHITDQIGMFSFTGLTVKQCEVLTEKYHIYLLKSGRISLCGINDHNMDYIVEAFADVITNH